MIDWITIAVILVAVLVIAASISWTVRQFLVRLALIGTILAIGVAAFFEGMSWLGAYLKQ